MNQTGREFQNFEKKKAAHQQQDPIEVFKHEIPCNKEIKTEAEADSKTPGPTNIEGKSDLFKTVQKE